MAKKRRKKIWVIAVFVIFILYFFGAARPIPRETVFVPLWLSSLESDSPVIIGTPASGAGVGWPVPFALGNRFGYIDSEGRFLLNREKTGEIYLGENLWAGYEALPANIEIRNNLGELILNIENPGGYPVLLDNRIFILGSEQNALSEIDLNGRILWTYEFAAPLTSIDAAAGLVLTGSIDGVIEVLDNRGRRVFMFEPGGSRYAVILGVAISRDGSRLGVVSGIQNKRFLKLERFGAGEYMVVYHEFLGTGFRRPVHISFFDQDRWIAFEREGGIGLYEIGSRQEVSVALDGQIAAIDQSGGQGFFFAVSSLSETRKELVGIQLPGTVAVRAPFKSTDAFLERRGSRLLAGGGSTLISFELEKH